MCISVSNRMSTVSGDVSDTNDISFLSVPRIDTYSCQWVDSTNMNSVNTYSPRPVYSVWTWTHLAADHQLTISATNFLLIMS